MHPFLPPASHSSSQRSEGRDKPISNLLGQLRVAIARKQLDGIRRHPVCLSTLSLNPSILSIFPVCMYPFPVFLLSLFSFQDANWFLARACCKQRNERMNWLAILEDKEGVVVCCLLLENGHLAWYSKANRFVGAVSSELMFLKKIISGFKVSSGVRIPAGKSRVGCGARDPNLPTT
jgi:hypothetical protein